MSGDEGAGLPPRSHPSEERLRRIFEALPDGVATLDGQGFILAANPVLCRRGGRGFEELRRKSFASFFPDESRGALLAAFRSSLGGEPARLEVGYDHPRARPRRRLQVTLVPMGEGGAERVLAIVRDLTRLRASQARASMNEARLRAELEAKNAALSRALAELGASARSQEELLNAVAHEIRTPLTSILVGAELIAARAGEEMPPRCHRQLELLRRNAILLQRLAQDLLDLSRLRRGAYEVRWGEVRLEALAKGAVEVVEPLIDQKELDLEIDIAGSVPPTWWTDGDLLGKILLNLLQNACKFTDRGGVRLEIEREDGCLLFRVVDTGRGIPEGELGEVFREFRQLGGSGGFKTPGAGLGLSMVRRFADLLGGSVSVRSEVGSGSTFTLRVPQGPGCEGS